MKHFIRFWIVGLLILCAAPARGATFTIITPYTGSETNTYTNPQYGLNLTDSQTMNGLYIQRIDTEKYQWNLFLYQTNDINYSDLRGANFIYDRYFGGDTRHKNVVGVGMNYLTMNMAGRGVPTAMGTLDGMNLDLTVYSPYFRIGRYYNFDWDQAHVTLLPWCGGEWDLSKGDGAVDPPGPFPGTVSFGIDDYQYSWIAGLNTKIEYRHFLQAELKRSIVLNSNDYYNKYTASINIFVSRNVGLSYRYNEQETISGKDSYRIFGITVLF